MVDLVAARLLPPLARGFLDGEAAELYLPLTSAETGLTEAPEVNRRELAEALAVANTSYGHRRAGELARKLADPATRVVVTGQQPGLFGGPLYTLSKAVAAVLWAERLEAEGRPAVAVFWVSTEDHDFREISRTRFPTPSGILEIDLGEDPSPLLPIGIRTLGEPVVEAVEKLRGTNPGERYTRWIERLSGWYRPEVRFGEAFSRLMVGVLGDRCPLLLDALLPAVKAAERPWLERMVRRREEIEEAFVARDRLIEERGFPLQVTPQRGASPLFVLHGQERRRVEWRGEDRFMLRGAEPYENDVDSLLELIEENPAVVSAGVMGRSALQDAILGTSVLLLGPGEISYIPQVAPIYEVLEIAPPAVALRPQVMVMMRHQIEKMEALEVTLGELVAPELDVDVFLAGDRAGDIVEPAREAILARLDDLRREAVALDADLERPYKKTRQQIERALENFSGRVTASLGRREEIARSRLVALRDSVCPGGSLQERIVSTAHFPGKLGEGLGAALFGQLGLDPGRLHVVVPEEES
jgi:bacillithiol biosynthesis cysteine-adding enzyme BshC